MATSPDQKSSPAQPKTPQRLTPTSNGFDKRESPSSHRSSKKGSPDQLLINKSRQKNDSPSTLSESSEDTDNGIQRGWTYYWTSLEDSDGKLIYSSGPSAKANQKLIIVEACMSNSSEYSDYGFSWLAIHGSDQLGGKSIVERFENAIVVCIVLDFQEELDQAQLRSQAFVSTLQSISDRIKALKWQAHNVMLSMVLSDPAHPVDEQSRGTVLSTEINIVQSMIDKLGKIVGFGGTKTTLEKDKEEAGSGN